MTRELIRRQSRLQNITTFKAYLGEDYDGFGQHVLLTMSRGSTSGAFRARVASGDFNTSAHFPAGTEVIVFSNHGQLEVLTLGSPREVRPLASQVVVYGRDDLNFLYGTDDLRQNLGEPVWGSIPYLNDGDDNTQVGTSQVWCGNVNQYWYHYWTADIGTARTVYKFQVLNGAGAGTFGDFGFTNDIQYSDDGVNWTSTAMTVGAVDPYIDPNWQVWGRDWTLATPSSHRYWGLGGYLNGPLGWSAGSGYKTWRIIGDNPL